MIKRLLEYLFFKFYSFQVKVGNEDIAPFSSILIISVVFGFIYHDIVLFCYRFIPFFSNDPLPPWYVFLIVYMIVFIVMYFVVLNKNKYRSILITHEEEWKGKKNLGVILFVVVPIVLLYLGLFI